MFYHCPQDGGPCVNLIHQYLQHVTEPSVRERGRESTYPDPYTWYIRLFLGGRCVWSDETFGLPEWATGGGGCDLYHGVAHRQCAEKDGEQEESHVEVACGGHTKEVARWLVEEVDGKCSAIEE